MIVYYDWTPEDERRLLELRKRGLTFSQLAEKFGVSRSAISGKLWRLNA